MQGDHIRNAVRVIIIEDGKVLLCKYKDMLRTPLEIKQIV